MTYFLKYYHSYIQSPYWGKLHALLYYIGVYKYLLLFAHFWSSSCQCVSRSWREIFKSNQIWKIICQIYGISTRYLNDDTGNYKPIRSTKRFFYRRSNFFIVTADYFAVFLSRMALYFAVEKNAEYYLMWHKRIEDSPNLRSVTLREDVS